MRFRAVFPVKTICMHGSPLSKFDNRDLWQFYDYREFGVIAEPYFDIDLMQVFYITDTGRMWNNAKSSVRDRVESGFDIAVRDTDHLVELALTGALPDQLMINAHPQRWHERALPWVKGLAWQNVKNVGKMVLRG